MQALRRATFLARLVLAWFAFSLGVAIASPLVKPVGVDVVCAGGGAIKLVAQGGDGGEPSTVHAMDCPLCGPAGAPPVADAALGELVSQHTRIVSHFAGPPVPSRTAAPLPARGPPQASTSR